MLTFEKCEKLNAWLVSACEDGNKRIDMRVHMQWDACGMADCQSLKAEEREGGGA